MRTARCHVIAITVALVAKHAGSALHADIPCKALGAICAEARPITTPPTAARRVPRANISTLLTSITIHTTIARDRRSVFLALTRAIAQASTQR